MDARPGAIMTAPGWLAGYFLNVKNVLDALRVMLTPPLVVSVSVAV